MYKVYRAIPIPSLHNHKIIFIKLSLSRPKFIFSVYSFCVPNIQKLMFFFFNFWIFMSPKYVLKKCPGFSKLFLKTKLANFKISKKRVKKYILDQNITFYQVLFASKASILGLKYFRFENYGHITKRTPNIKKV